MHINIDVNLNFFTLKVRIGKASQPIENTATPMQGRLNLVDEERSFGHLISHVIKRFGVTAREAERLLKDWKQRADAESPGGWIVAWQWVFCEHLQTKNREFYLEDGQLEARRADSITVNPN